MHVVHCIFSMCTGGAETMLVDIMNGQSRRGYRVTLVVVNDRMDEHVVAAIDSGVKVVYMHRREGSAPLLLLFRLNMLLWRLKPDIVHLHDEKLCTLARPHRRHMLYTAHCFGIDTRYLAGTPIAAISDAVAADVSSRAHGAKVRTILNGIVTSAIDRRPERQPDIYHLVQVARLYPPQKGQDIAVEAIAELRRRSIDNVDFTFIGDGPARHELEALARRLGVADRIHFEGIRDRAYIYSHLKNFDAMVHPSRSEGFGLTVAEGMAAGLPIVATEHDGPWEVADRGHLCISVPKDDAKALADAIEGLIAHYPEALLRATEALAFVARYDMTNTLDAYDAYYSELLKR